MIERSIELKNEQQQYTCEERFCLDFFGRPYNAIKRDTMV
jgi:hypothetical protein